MDSLLVLAIVKTSVYGEVPPEAQGLGSISPTDNIFSMPLKAWVCTHLHVGKHPLYIHSQRPLPPGPDLQRSLS